MSTISLKAQINKLLNTVEDERFYKASPLCYKLT